MLSKGLVQVLRGPASAFNEKSLSKGLHGLALNSTTAQCSRNEGADKKLVAWLA